MSLFESNSWLEPCIYVLKFTIGVQIMNLNLANQISYARIQKSN